MFRAIEHSDAKQTARVEQFMSNVYSIDIEEQGCPSIQKNLTVRDCGPNANKESESERQHCGVMTDNDRDDTANEIDDEEIALTDAPKK